jgi:hypothetical protein
MILYKNPLLTLCYPSDHFQLSHLLTSAPHHDKLNRPPQLAHPSYSPLSAGSEPSGDTPTDLMNLGFPQASELYSAWDSFHPPPDILPNATFGVSPPTLHHSTLDPTLHPNSPCRQSPWSTEDVRIGSVDEVLHAPSNYDLPAFPLHNHRPSPHPHLDNTSEPYRGTLDTSYPCLWTKGDIICNVMVQATRSHMNRHLHAYHGFGGSDTRQTRCCWAGCEATMQQGSIARHMVTRHLQTKVTCPMCSKKLSRQDVISKHQRVCPAASTLR